MKIYTLVEFIWNEVGQTYEQIYCRYEDYNGDISWCKGGGGGGDSTSVVRYAPYVETHHEAFLNIVATKRDTLISDSPFTGFSLTDAKNAVDYCFFGVGYTLASFPSLYDMYGKFLAGLDIEVLFDQTFEDTVNSAQVANLVSAEASLMDDDIEINIIPALELGMRDINSVMSSTFIIGRTQIMAARDKSLAKFSAELKYRLIPVAVDRWKNHLEWNKGIIRTYAEVIKLYFSARMDVDEYAYSTLTKNKLWPFTVLEYDRIALGALEGATTTHTDVAGASTVQKVIGGALSGAGMGASVGGGHGALIGGILGLAGSLF